MSASVALAGCESALSTLAPAGPAAQLIAQLWWAMLAGAALLTVWVLALVAWGFRAPRGQGPNARFWIGGLGIGMTLAVLVAVVGAGLWVGERTLARPDPQVVAVQARAQQWSWDFVQPGRDGTSVQTHNTLYIPVGVPVDVHITTADVIHSFWVPRLGGKLDAIPGRTNVLRLQADAAGRYAGLSAEFSGVGYGGMRFTVVAYPADDIPTMEGRVHLETSTKPAAEGL